jgi:hypothetical protein
MENKIIKKEDMDLFYKLRRPISYATALAMVGWQIERYSEDLKKEFEHSNPLKKLICYPDEYRWKIESHPDNRRKMKISLAHTVHKQLVFNLYKGNVHDEFDEYFDEAETAYSILLKPVKVDDIDWIKRQNHFLIEFSSYLSREVKLRSLELENPLEVVARAHTRAVNNLFKSYTSLLHGLNSTLFGRKILRDIL